MRKIIILLLCCGVLVSMVGCGGNTAPPPTESPPTTVSETVMKKPKESTKPMVTIKPTESSVAENTEESGCITIVETDDPPTFSLLFSLLSFIWKRQFERKEKSEKLRVKRPKRNDNLLSKIVVSFWRRRRDSNSRGIAP